MLEKIRFNNAYLCPIWLYKILHNVYREPANHCHIITSMYHDPFTKCTLRRPFHILLYPQDLCVDV